MLVGTLSAPGCAGCARIAASVVEHTEECLAALDAVLPSVGPNERQQ
jgi:hypothetical protein